MEKTEHKISINSESTTCSVTKSKEKSNEVSKESQVLLNAIAFTLLKVISENKSKKNYKEKIKAQSHNLYSSKSVPSISVSDYLLRAKKYAKMEDSTLVYSLILIDRFLKKKILILTDLNVHRLLFASLLVSIKYNEDKFYNNKYYAKIGGMELESLNNLEFDFLVALEFNLVADFKLFEKYYRNLISVSMEMEK